MKQIINEIIERTCASSVGILGTKESLKIIEQWEKENKLPNEKYKKIEIPKGMFLDDSKIFLIPIDDGHFVKVYYGE